MEDITHSLNIFVEIAHEIIHKNIGYCKVSYRRVAKCLPKNTNRKELASDEETKTYERSA